MSAYNDGMLLNKILLYPGHRDVGYLINKVLQGVASTCNSRYNIIFPGSTI